MAEPRADPPAVLVTGCSTGIGRCAARMLKTRGYRVFAAARKPADVADLAAEGHEAVTLDLADPASIASAVGLVLAATGGRIYGLFNNAAYAQPGAVEDLTRKALKAQFEVNLFGTVELTARVIPAMRRAGAGRIVMNSSVLGLVALPYRGAYAASKYALEGIADTLRLELAGTGIYVSLLEPGAIRTPFRANAAAAWERLGTGSEGPHAAAYARMAARRHADAPPPAFSLPPEPVVRALIRALEARRPKARYRVTLPAHAIAVLKRLLPDRALDRLLRGSG